MKKKKTTIKYKQNSPLAYQFGGLMGNLDFYKNLNTQWGNFWKGGDYFKDGYDPSVYNYDPQNPTANDPWGNNLLQKTVKQNENAVNSYNAGMDFNKNYKGYVGDNSDDAFKFYQNQNNNKYKDSLDSFNSYDTAVFEGADQKKIGYNNDGSTYFYSYDGDGNQIPWVDPVKPEGYDAYKNFDPTKQWRDDKISYDGNAANLSDAKNRMSQGFSNTVGGIFTGLNYINSAKKQAPINLNQGFQGVQYAQYGDEIGPSLSNYSVTSENPNKTINAFNGPIADKIRFDGTGTPLQSEFELVQDNNDILEALAGLQGVPKGIIKGLSKYQLVNLLKANTKPIISTAAQQGLQEGVSSWENGGNINLTGYLPGSPTQFNRSNTIPGGDVSMKDMDKRLIAIVKGGGKDGLITPLEIGKEYSFGSKSVTELPIDPFKEQPIQTAQFGANVIGLDKLAQQAKDQYLSQIAGSEQYGPEKSSIEFNNRMQKANDNALAHSSGAYYQQGVPLGKPAEEYNPYEFDGVKGRQFGYTPGQSAGIRALMNTGLIPGTLPGMGFDDSISAQPSSNGSKSKSEVYSIKGDKTYDYTQDANGNWLTKRKNSSSGWIDMKNKLSPEDYKTAVDNIQKGNVKQATTPTGRARTSNTVVNNTSNYNGVSGEVLSYLKKQGLEVNGENISAMMKDTSNLKPSQGLNWNGDLNSINTLGYVPTPQVYAPAINEIKGTPVDYPSISQQRGETESRALGLLKMTPEEAVIYDSKFPKAIAKNNKNYLKTLDNERQSLSNKVTRLEAEIAKMKPSSSSTDFERKPRKYKEEELDILKKELAKKEKEYNRKESQLNISTTMRYGKPRKLWNEVDPKLFGKAVNPRLSKALNLAGLYQYGGLVSPVPSYQFGGAINNDYTYPVHPITEEFTEIQTEKGEVVSLPDYTIVNVKADKSHKQQDKDNVTDILPAESYVFSDDPNMKLSLDDKIGGVAIRDMKLGRSAFEYKENEITAGPTDIYFSKLWGNEKELTPAQLVNKVKKKLEVRDQKNDFFVERANMENKEQRKEYLDIIKAFSEYKKPKSKRIPKAQYGMNIPNMNVGLPKMYNQPTNNALDGVFGYNNKAMDPYYGMDNNVKSMYNISSSMDTKLFENGGNVPQAQFGWIGAGIDAIGGWSERAREKQEQENKIKLGRYNKLTGEYTDSVERTGAVDTAGALASYMASLNVPDIAYNDNSAALATMSDSYNRQNAILNAQKYTAAAGAGAVGSLARFANPNTMGSYLAASANDVNQQVSDIISRQAQLEASRAGTIADLHGRGIDNFNNAINAENTQKYNANVGIGNVGRAGSTAIANLGNARYQTGLDTLSYEEVLKNSEQAAFDKSRSKIEGIANDIGGLGITALMGGFGKIGGNSKVIQSGGTNNQQSTYSNENPYGFNGTKGYDMSNYTSNPYSFQQMSAPLSGNSNSMQMVNRDNSAMANNIWNSATTWGFNPFTGEPINRR